MIMEYVYGFFKMMKLELRALFISIMILSSLSYIVTAHQPNFVNSETTIITNPNISQAFYGELKGEPHYYIIQSEEEFKLFAEIMVPKMDNIKKDFILEINDESISLETWSSFHEHYVNDEYFRGPRYVKNNALGTYKSKVSNLENSGKYIFSIGTQEHWPITETMPLIIKLPKMKHFCGKPVYTAITNKIGMIVYGIFLFTILIASFCIYITTKIIKKKRFKR